MIEYDHNSMAAIFQKNSAIFGEKAYASYKKDGRWADISWKAMNSLVHDLANYLISIGMKKGDRVGIFSPNRWEWHLAALAINSTGAVDVPIYATNSAEETEYILGNSDSKACFVGAEEHLAKVLKARSKLPMLEKVIIFDEANVSQKRELTLSKALSIGKETPNSGTLEQRMGSLRPSDLSTLMYTSGTTGNPKGVMLTHGNFVSNVQNTFSEMKDLKTGRGLIGPDDVFLSFLPLSHSLERTAGFHGAILSGAKTVFAENLGKLLANCKEVRPSIIISVPRIYEKFHAGILTKSARVKGPKKAIFNFAMRQAERNLPYVCRDLRRKGLFAIKYRIAEKLVLSSLKKNMGMDRLRFAISGGAPLSQSDAEFFIGMGCKILEGFGLTETSPIMTFNRPWNIKPGTVGHPIPETEIKISDDGEILVRGPQVMTGYYKNEEATGEALMPDGFFRTGDIGIIDGEGFLKITGRIKDIIVTAGGKNISPQNLEESLKKSPFIEQAGIIGDGRKYLTALIVPEFRELKKWAGENGVKFSSRSDLIASEAVRTLFRKEIDAHTSHVSRVEQIRKFTILDAEWTQASGELTPTQKVKRKIINGKYAKEIEAMYPRGGPA